MKKPMVSLGPTGSNRWTMCSSPIRSHCLLGRVHQKNKWIRWETFRYYITQASLHLRLKNLQCLTSRWSVNLLMSAWPISHWIWFNGDLKWSPVSSSIKQVFSTNKTRSSNFRVLYHNAPLWENPGYKLQRNKAFKVDHIFGTTNQKYGRGTWGDSDKNG